MYTHCCIYTYIYIYTYRLDDPVLRSDNLLHDAQHAYTERDIKARKSLVHIRCTSVSVCFQPRYAHQTLIVYDLYYEHCPFMCLRDSNITARFQVKSCVSFFQAGFVQSPIVPCTYTENATISWLSISQSKNQKNHDIK